MPFFLQVNYEHIRRLPGQLLLVHLRYGKTREATTKIFQSVFGALGGDAESGRGAGELI